MACTKDHTALPKHKLDGLPESQAVKGRHKCTSCAYELGFAEGGKTEENLRKQVRLWKERTDKLEALLIKHAVAIPE